MTPVGISIWIAAYVVQILDGSPTSLLKPALSSAMSLVKQARLLWACEFCRKCWRGQVSVQWVMGLGEVPWTYLGSLTGHTGPRPRLCTVGTSPGAVPGQLPQYRYLPVRYSTAPDPHRKINSPETGRRGDHRQCEPSTGRRPANSSLESSSQPTTWRKIKKLSNI